MRPMMWHRVLHPLVGFLDCTTRAPPGAVVDGVIENGTFPTTSVKSRSWAKREVTVLEKRDPPYSVKNEGGERRRRAAFVLCRLCYFAMFGLIQRAITWPQWRVGLLFMFVV
jgi:hypothetical protein